MNKLIPSTMAAGLFALCSADAAVLACFDADGQGGPTNTGYESIALVTTQNGVTLTITNSTIGNFNNRDRGGSRPAIDGRPDEALLQDFFSLDVGATLTFSGLSANQSYDVTIYSYDAQFANNSTTTWYQDSVDPGNLLGTITSNVNSPDTSQMTVSLTSNASGEIVVVGGAGSDGRIRFNGIEIVPEPSSSALAASGLLLLLGQRRRK